MTYFDHYEMPADLVAEHMTLLENGSPLIEPWKERLRGPNERRPKLEEIARFKRRARLRVSRTASARRARPVYRARAARRRRVLRKPPDAGASDGDPEPSSAQTEPRRGSR